MAASMPPPPPPDRTSALRRRREGVIWIVGAVLVVLVFIAVATNKDSTGCATADPGWATQLSMPSGTYVYEEAGSAFNGHDAWVVTKDDGAVWATDVDPGSEPSSGGLVVPLNRQAYEDADVGRQAFARAGTLFPDASSDGACSPPE